MKKFIKFLKKMSKSDRRTMITAIITTCIMLTCISTTTALLTSYAGPVENTFTIGNINLELTETSGDTYQLIPGSTVFKDPTVTVIEGSEDCWLFVKIRKDNNFDEYLSYVIEDGWISLDGHSDVYYRSVTDVDVNRSYNVLRDNAIVVRDDITKEKMGNISSA